jgi:hypothetical protein
MALGFVLRDQCAANLLCKTRDAFALSFNLNLKGKRTIASPGAQQIRNKWEK